MKTLNHGQWPAGADDTPPPQPAPAPADHKPTTVKTCPRPKCGAVYSGDSHACRDPR